MPLISATQSCHIHPIAKHQIVDLDVFPWSLDPETSPVESIVLENFSFFFHRHAIFIPSQNTKSSIWTCSRGPWTLKHRLWRVSFWRTFRFFFSRKGEKISDRTTLPRETPKDRSRKHPGKVTKQKSETRLRFRRALSLNFKRRFEKATLL